MRKNRRKNKICPARTTRRNTNIITVNKARGRYHEAEARIGCGEEGGTDNTMDQE